MSVANKAGKGQRPGTKPTPKPPMPQKGGKC